MVVFKRLPTGVLGISNNGKIQDISKFNDVTRNIPSIELSSTVKLSHVELTNNTPLDISSPTSKRTLRNVRNSSPFKKTIHSEQVGQFTTQKDRHISADVLDDKEMMEDDVETNKDITNLETANLQEIQSSNIPSDNNAESTDQPDNISQIYSIDNDRKIVKDYLHDLLNYININNASLNNDRDGNLTYFMDKMPESEKNMQFENWTQTKVKSIHKTFTDDIDNKKKLMMSEFALLDHQIRSINTNTNENDALLRHMANSFGIEL